MVGPIIIDTDPGVDDAYALIFAVAASLSIEGVTIVHGNGGCVKNLGINAKCCLRIAGADPSVQVYLGSADPIEPVKLDDSTLKGVDVHGPDGLGEMRPTLLPSDSEFPDVPAAEFIYQRCKEKSGEITLVTLGALTNIAMALKKHPDLVEHVKGLVIMGGALLEKRGNRTPSAEANFACDPVAAQMVLRAGFKDVVLAPLDLTHKLDLIGLRTKLAAMGGELASFLCDISAFYIRAYHSRDHTVVPVHDPATVAFLVRPELFDTKLLCVDVETAGVFCAGQSVVDWTGQTGRAKNCKVLLGVNSAAFDALFLSAIADAQLRTADRPSKRARVTKEDDLGLPAATCPGPSACCGTVLSNKGQVGPGVVRVGVGVMILQEGRDGHVLVSRREARRKGSHGAGKHQLPGGHLEAGETWEECAIRETLEETGIELKKCYFAAVTNDVMPEDGKHYITIMMVATCSADQEPKLLEPNKSDGWSWEPWGKLPGELFHPLQKLHASNFKLPLPSAIASAAFPSTAFSPNCAHMP